MSRLAILIVAMFLLTGCSTSAAPRDGTAIADSIRQPTTTKIITITAANDPNGKIGTATGYVSAAVIYDAGVTCDDLGVHCGATIEVYATAEQANSRADYIRALSGISDEVDTVNGVALLRADGKLPAATAAAYAEAFGKG